MRHNIIITHYVCGGLFDERFAVTNGLGPPSIEMLLLIISTSPFRPRFIIGGLLYVCRTYVEKSECTTELVQSEIVFFSVFLAMLIFLNSSFAL